MKKISVIVPVYNVEKYLGKCLESIAKQTIADEIEAIIINDGSPDNSQTIIDEYVEKYPQIFKSFKKDNGGLGSARNFGLKYCTGEYITFLDSDDYLKEQAYENVYNKAKSEELDIVMFDMRWFYSETGREESRNMLPTFLHEFNIHTYVLSNPRSL